MINETINDKQGHWILARLGKRVLRPGGRGLTLQMIDHLEIQNSDDIVEFAPGMGYTAKIALSKNPKSYTGIELNLEAAERLQKKILGRNRKIVTAHAEETGLPANSFDKVYGEAMLTMQSDSRKSMIVREAARILRPGGYYGIHELGLIPETIPNEVKEIMQKTMAKTVRVNSRPLTQKEWTAVLEREGLEVVWMGKAPMRLLEGSRIVQDEGILQTIRIGYNVLTHPRERARMLEMRDMFRRYREHIRAFSFVARKKG